MAGKIAGLALAAMALSACSSSMPTPDTVVPEVSSYHAPLAAHAISSGEKLKLIAFGAEGLSGDYVVGKDGKLDLGRWGKVDAAGLSAPQLEEAIAARLAARGTPGARIAVMPDAV